MSREQFDFAVENLFRMDEFESGEMMNEVMRRLATASQNAPSRENPLLSTWPQPTMLSQVVSRLDQWSQTQEPPAEWHSDPALASLPASLASLPMLQNPKVLSFGRYDGFALLEAVWMRGLANWVCGDELDDVVKAERMFDWTVRNLQVPPLPEYGVVAAPQPQSGAADATVKGADAAAAASGDAKSAQPAADKDSERVNRAAAPATSPKAPAEPQSSAPGDFDPAVGRLAEVPQVPWETLFFGNGTPLERAWVFMSLCRQKHLDAALLAVADPTHPAAPPVPWAVGVLADGEVYLFDIAAGLPVRGPEPVQYLRDQGLQVRPATLRQVIANPELLRTMDVGPDRRYPMDAARLQHVVALIEAPPAFLSAKMRLLESRLSGEQSLVLTTTPSADIARWKKTGGISEARLWLFPYETLQRRMALSSEAVADRLRQLMPFYITPISSPLRQGRVRYLLGELGSEPAENARAGATSLLQVARLSDKEIAQQGAAARDVFVKQLLAEVSQLPPEQQIAARERAVAAAEQQVAVLMALLERVKQDATLWLGLVGMERKNWAMAIDYFLVRSLQVWPHGVWVPLARFNLARSLEANGRPKEAVVIYGDDPRWYGDQLRAKWLSEVIAKAETTAKP